MMPMQGFIQRGGGLEFPTPSQNPPPRNLKINDVIIKMYDFSPLKYLQSYYRL